MVDIGDDTKIVQRRAKHNAKQHPQGFGLVSRENAAIEREAAPPQYL
jgi:hypothetical protein